VRAGCGAIEVFLPEMPLLQRRNFATLSCKLNTTHPMATIAGMMTLIAVAPEKNME
jgi:hypothetical protein